MTEGGRNSYFNLLVSLSRAAWMDQHGSRARSVRQRLQHGAGSSEAVTGAPYSLMRADRGMGSQP